MKKSILAILIIAITYCATANIMTPRAYISEIFFDS